MNANFIFTFLNSTFFSKVCIESLPSLISSLEKVFLLKVANISSSWTKPFIMLYYFFRFSSQDSSQYNFKNRSIQLRFLNQIFNKNIEEEEPLFVQKNFVHICIKDQLNQYEIDFLSKRFFKNRELYWSNLSKNTNLGWESLVHKSGVQIQVVEGLIFCLFSFFLYLFKFFVH